MIALNDGIALMRLRCTCTSDELTGAHVAVERHGRSIAFVAPAGTRRSANISPPGHNRRFPHKGGPSGDSCQFASRHILLGARGNARA